MGFRYAAHHNLSPLETRPQCRGVVLRRTKRVGSWLGRVVNGIVDLGAEGLGRSDARPISTL